MNVKYFSPITNVNSNNKTWNNSGILRNNNSARQESSIASSISTRISDKNKAKSNSLSEQTRTLMRNLNNVQAVEAVPYGEILKKKTFTGTVQNKQNGFFDLTSTYENMKKSLPTNKYKYNYKAISSRIISAKTSVSAGQAVIAAKRKVMEVKRKLSVNTDDADELQAALIHAERMEMAARKKKHNLEQEELVSNTIKRDDSLKKQEDASQDSTDMMDEVVSAVEEEISNQEDAIFEERFELMEDIISQIEDSGMEEMSEEMMQQINEFISSFGEEELQELEDAMQLMESMEIIDPHMSEEEFEKLKTKHRTSEYKAIMKADMDYLKAIVKLNVATPSVDAPVSSDAPAAPSIPSFDMAL
ncbi:MAG: hypothetical protein K5644_08520 [Lachnospiraceae bacterium]|nr:hypothetical protein [Lachnospiraceae bacterium]